MTKFDFDPRLPDFHADPYPFYDRLRTHAPVYAWEGSGITFVTRFEDCSNLLHDHRLGIGEFTPPPPSLRPLFELQTRWILLKDPPDHTRLRSLVYKAFTPRMIEKLRGTIQRITDQLLDRVQARGEMDLIADLAYPLPLTVITTLLGVPPEDHHKVRDWSDALARVLDLTDDLAICVRATEATIAFTAYLRELLDQRRADPRDDLLSALVAVEEPSATIGPAEIEANCILLLLAGHETTRNLIGNGILALLRYPDQLHLLRQNPALIQGAIEELLRFESPVQMTGRTVLEEITVRGQTLRRGQRIGLMLGAANRDPEKFESPHRLDITRKPNPHLAFGGGIHFCLGAPLARLQGQIAVNTILRRMPNLALAIDTPVYNGNYLLRGLQNLPLTF